MPAPFELGQTVITCGALAVLPPADVLTAMRRHAAGDWGDVADEDWNANEQALVLGERLFSVYHSSQAQKFWIITEHDRSATTILLPEEY